MRRVLLLLALCSAIVSVTCTETVFLEEDAAEWQAHQDLMVADTASFVESHITATAVRRQSGANGDGDVRPAEVTRLFYSIAGFGSMTLDKLKAWMASRGSSADNTESWFKSLDKDKDGKISLTEFLRVFVLASRVRPTVAEHRYRVMPL